MRYLTAGTLSVLILAVLVGLVAAYGVRSLMLPQEETPPVAPQTTNVPLASADLPAGRMLALGDMSLMPMTQEQLSGRGWPLHLVMLSSDQVIGRRLKQGISQGDPFLTTDFYLEGEGPSYVSLLKPGYRAVSVPVPLNRGGYVSPGSSVDVVFRASPREADENTTAIPETTIMLIEAAEVLAVERPLESQGRRPISGIDLRSREIPERETPPTIILAVTSDQANKLQAVEGHGEISLVSRPMGEVGLALRPGPLTLEDLLGIEPLLPAESEPMPIVTEVFRGSQRTVNAFAPQGDRFVPVDPAATSSQ
jgi:Flp pilus assembly protein CpaB